MRVGGVSVSAGSLSRAAASVAGPAIDVRTIAAELDVDSVMTGTLLRAGNQIRVSTQLLEVPSGTLVWSYHTQVNIHDVFQVQDELVQRIIASRCSPYSTRAKAATAKIAGHCEGL